jgi:hypothetical protein
LSATGKILKISDEYIDEIKHNLNVFQVLREHVPDKSIEELVVVPDVDSGRHLMMRIPNKCKRIFLPINIAHHSPSTSLNTAFQQLQAEVV